MNKPAQHRRWFPDWRMAARPVEDDAADYGTAFGLDMSLTEVPPPTVAAPALGPKAGAGWVRRLALRRKPAI